MTRLGNIAALAGLVTWQARLPDLTFHKVSASVEQVLGYRPEDYYRSGFWESTLHPEDRDSVIQFCAERTVAGTDHVFDYRTIAADGSVVTVRDVVSVRPGLDGEKLLFGAFIDISSEKTRAPRDQAARPLFRQDQPIQELPTLTDIEARIGEDPAISRPPQARLADIVSVAMTARRAAARDAGVAEGSVPLRIHPSLGGTVHVDPDHLRCAIHLLIHTAMLTPEADRSVEIDQTEDGSDIRVRLVAPHQSGYADALLPSNPAQIREQALSVARIAWLVSRLGGSTKLADDEGRLWAHELRIPLPSPPAEAQTDRTNRPALLRVLYAEDNVTSAQVMSALLGLQRVHSEIAINGEDAVTLWEEGAFDLVLMDVKMPVLDGIGATRRIRARERETARPRTPIIGITAHLDEDVRRRCLEAGLDDLLAKPLRLEQLRALVERFGPGRWPYL